MKEKSKNKIHYLIQIQILSIQDMMELVILFSLEQISCMESLLLKKIFSTMYMEYYTAKITEKPSPMTLKNAS